MSRVLWDTRVILTQEDHYKFKASLGYIRRFYLNKQIERKGARKVEREEKDSSCITGRSGSCLYFTLPIVILAAVALVSHGST